MDIFVHDGDIERLIEEKLGRMKTLRNLLEKEGWKEKVLETVLKKIFNSRADNELPHKRELMLLLSNTYNNEISPGLSSQLPRPQIHSPTQT